MIMDDHAISLHFPKDLSPEEKRWDQQRQKANIVLPSPRLPQNYRSNKLLLLQPRQNFLPVIPSSQICIQAAHMAKVTCHFITSWLQWAKRTKNGCTDQPCLDPATACRELPGPKGLSH